MILEYFTQLWNKITAVAEYPIEFFQNIGDAVGGAIGGFFTELIHVITDLGIFFLYLFQVAKSVFLIIINPLIYLVTLIYTFITNLFEFEFTYEQPIEISQTAQDILEMIPYWSTLSSVIGAIFLFLIGFKIFKIISSE